MPKRSRSPIRDTKESLSYLTRKQLQAKAKSLGVKANMKSTDIVNAIVERLREAEDLEEMAASARHASTATPEQQHQVATPVATRPSRGDTLGARASRSRTRLAGHKTTSPQDSNTESPSGGKDESSSTQASETRQAKRMRVELEEAQRLAEEAESAAEEARVAKQRAEVALASIKRHDEGMPRAMGQTLYEREPTPLERLSDATPVPSRGPSPAELLPSIPDDVEPFVGNPVGRDGAQHEGEQGRSTEEARAAEEQDEDKENNVDDLSEEGDKENRSCPATPISIASSKASSIPRGRSPSLVVDAVPRSVGPDPSTSGKSKPTASHPLTKANIRDALQRLDEASLKIEEIQRKVDRSEVTITRMKNTAREGAKIIESNFSTIAALESSLLKHVKRNPTILDGNGFDEKDGGAARQEKLRRAYYKQQKKDREESEAKEAEKARKKRQEQDVREAAEANRETLEEEGSSGSSDGSLELDPNAIALISAGGDLEDLMGIAGARDEEEESREDEGEDETEDSSDNSGDHEDVKEGSVTPPRVTWKKDTVRFNTNVRVQWEMEEEGEDGEYNITRISN